MIKLFWVIASTISFISCSIKFEEIPLYDEYKKPLPSSIRQMNIFSDSEGTLWNSLSNCGEFKVTQETSYKGSSSIKLSWNKSKDCEWIGFGNSFNNWQPINLNKLINNKAISFFVRTQSEKVAGLPFVLALEDFSGGGSYLFVDCKKYLKGLSIDTNWKQVIVPMWDFPIGDEVENDDLDLFSIKQLKFQLEGAGSFFIDEIELIDFDNSKLKSFQREVELLKPTGERNQIVYRKGQFANDIWGHSSKLCHDLKEFKDSANKIMLSWDFSSSQCNAPTWGINWNNWYPLNLRGLEENTVLYLKSLVDKSASFKIIIEDFKGHASEILISELQVNSWQETRIPLSKFKLSYNKIEIDRIKQIKFQGVGNGKILIEDIKLKSI